MGKLSQAMDRVDDLPREKKSPLVSNNHERAAVSENPQSRVAVKEASPYTGIPDKPPAPALPSSPADTSRWNERLLSATARLSSVSENIRKLRTLILHPENGRPIRSVMVTSSSPSEGKSFICANLAISIAKSIERHAMMLDCDLRRPTLQKLFGLNSEKGLSDYLLGNDTIPNLIQPTGLHKLSIIASGMPPENPAELLSAERMAALLDEMATRYRDRLLLLDTPPFHSAAETLVLSQHVDKVILVVRWGKSTTREVKKAADQIGSEKILGVVFNAVESNILDKKIQGLSYQDYYSNSYY